MNLKKLFYLVFIIVFSILLFNRLSVLSYSLMEGYQINNLYYIISIIILLLLSFIGVSMHKDINIVSGKNLYKSLLLFMSYIYIVSLVNSTYRPLNGLLYLSLLLPIPFFVYTIKATTLNCLNYFNLWSFICLCLCIITYISYQTRVSYFGNQVATNSSYIILLMYPLVLNSSNKILKIVITIITAFLLLFSLKRTGILSYIIVLFVYYMINTQMNKKRNLFLLFVVLFITLLLFHYLFDYVDGTVGNLLSDKFDSMKTGDSSDRDIVYAQVIQMIIQSDIVELFFGHGWDSVILDNPLGLSAHNDFLEITYDTGFVGLIIYIYLFYTLIKYALHLYKLKSKYAASFSASILIFFFFSLSSHIIIYTYMFMIIIYFWAMIIGTENCNNNKYK